MTLLRLPRVLAVGSLVAASCSARQDLGALPAEAIPVRTPSSVDSSDGAAGPPLKSPPTIDAGNVDAATRANAYVQTVLADRPLAYWRLEEASGTAAKDELGQHDCTWTTPPVGVSSASPQLGRAASLDGVNTVLNCGTLDDKIATGTASYSIEAWITVRSPDMGKFRWLLGHETFFPMRSGVSVYVDSGRYLCAERYVSGAQADYVAGWAPLGSGWSHIVVTWSAQGSLVYVNGHIGTPGLQSSATAQIPAGLSFNWGSGGGNFDGAMDELALYDAVLSPAQILAHYKAGVAN